MTRIRNIGIAVIMLFMTCAAYGQNNSCDDAVLEAKRSYESGDIKGCINRLEPCLPTISDKSLLATGYRLLSLAYLALDDNQNAHKFAVELLKVQPDYQKFPQIDPAEFTKIINTYAVEEKLWIGMRAGLNLNTVERMKSFSTYQSAQSYPASRGFQAGLFFDYAVHKNFYLSSFIYIAGLSIQHRIEDLDIFRQEYNEEQRYVGAQLSGIGRLALSKNIHINLGFGGGLGYLFESSVELNTINSETNSVQPYTLDALGNRNRYQAYLSGSLSITHKLGKGEFMLHVQYDHYFFNTLSDEHRYADLDFNLSSHYVNDDVRNRVFAFSIAYRHPIVFKIKHLDDE